MRLEQLKYFLSIAETQSINKTSLEFYTTHQGISKAIRQLEDEIGAPLFTRSSKGMMLTDEGNLLLPVAKRCVKDLCDIQLKISHRNRQQDLEGLLKLWGTPLTNVIVLPSLLDDLHLLYPKVRYQVEEAHTLDILRMVSLHKNALGSVLVLHAPEYQDIYAPYLQQVKLYPLQQDEHVGLVAADSPLAEQKRISLKDFATYPIATLASDAGEDHPINQLLQRFANTNIAFSAQTTRLVAQVVSSGKYVSFGSRRGVSGSAYFNNDNIVVLPFKEDLTIDIMLATNTHPELDEISQAFVELVKERSGSAL